MLSSLVLALGMTSITVQAKEPNALNRAISSKTTNVQEIRNATVKITYANTTFLVDPMLAKKGTYPGFEGTYRSNLRNPMIELPMSTDEVLKNVDAIIITHTHLDHWDDVAQKLIPKDLPVFVQNTADAKLVRSQGFKNVTVLNGSTVFEGITINKIGGQHGTNEMYKIPQMGETLGDIMGVVFQAPGHKTIYIAGDTIWRPEVDQTLQQFKPDIIVLNTGNALVNQFKESIIMGKEDTYHAYKVAPNAKIIAVHMDAINHTALSRKELREYIKVKGIGDRVYVPNDGQILSF